MALSKINTFATLLPTLVFAISYRAFSASEYVNFAFIGDTGNISYNKEVNETYKTNHDDFSISKVMPQAYPLTEERYATINDISDNNSAEMFNKNNNRLQNMPSDHKVKFDIEQATQGFMSSDEELTNPRESCIDNNNDFVARTLNDATKRLTESLQKNTVKKMTKNDKLSRNCHYQLNCNSQQYSYSITTVETVISKHIKEISVKQFSPTHNRRFFERKEITKKLPPQKTIVEIITSH